jgi:hypothetical protein
MLRSVVLLAALLAAGVAAAQTSVPPACARYADDMKHELELWQQPTIAVVTEAARAVAADVQLVAPGRRHDVVLPRHPETRFPAKPERDRGATDRFSGLLALEVPQAGTWRVSASTPVWIDIADNDRLVASSGFEMQDGCPLIHKVVEFPLQAGRRYWLQLSGNPAATVRILLTRRP